MRLLALLIAPLALLSCSGDKTTDAVTDDSATDDSDSADDSGATDDSGEAACEESFYWDGARCVFDWTDDWTHLTQDVTTLESGGSLPSALVVWGDTAFPVILDEDLRTFVAAARVGQGRHVHWGHETHLGGALTGEGDSAQLMRNAVSWTLEGPLQSDVDPVVGVTSDMGTLATFLEGEGYIVRQVGFSELDTVDVFATMTYDELTPAQYQAVQSFLTQGGGLLTGGQAWWFSYSTGEDAALGYPGNLMFPDSGITVSGETVNAGTDTVLPEPPGLLLHAGYALDLMLDHVAGRAPLVFNDQLLGAQTVGMAISALPLAFDDYFDRALAFTEAVGHTTPSASEPLRPAEQPIEDLVARLDHRFASELPPEEVQAHPAADDFPGAVPAEAERQTLTLTLDLAYEGRDSRYGFSGAGADLWLSTGAYAAPGEVLTVTLPLSAVGQGLTALIGSHSDTLWSLEEITRFPALTRSDDIDSAVTSIASAFGGLVYIRVPAGVDIGEVEVQIAGAVAAPRYVHGETSSEDWAQLRDNPAPWGELESDNLILTLPSERLAAIDDPSALMDFWEEVMAAQATLAAIDPDRVRAERFVVDRQISAGWMHSGYPIMAHLESTEELSSLATLQSDGSWGGFHELGHNHQWSDWELPGTTEGTVNLWSVYTCEEVIGVDRGACHSALEASTRTQRVSDYVGAGANYSSDWSVWTALETYLQLQETFGWAPFIALGEDYQALSSSERPSSEQAKIDLWVTLFSAEVQRDLGPFFVAWGWPVSASVLSETSAYPPWSDHPLAQ